MNAPLRSNAVSPALELLLLTYPLIQITRGVKRENYMRAWTRTAIAEARGILGDEPHALPEHPKAALLALHEIVLEMGEALGLSSVDFTAAYNDRRESMERGESITRATERAMAMLALFCARRMETGL